MGSTVKPAVVHYAAFPQAASGCWPITNTVRTIAEDPFFQAIELGWVDDPEERESVSQIVAASGLEVGYSAQLAQLSLGLNLCTIDERRRRANVAALSAYLRQAEELGARSFAILSGPDPDPLSRLAALDALTESVGELCQAAKPLGIEVWLEGFDRDIDRRMLIGPAGMAAQLAERVTREHSNFGLVVDLSHIPMLGETPLAALQPTAPYLSRVHVGNCVTGDARHPRYGDTHPSFGIPGGVNGVTELAAFLQVCLDVGYLRPGHPRVVALEVRPGPDEHPDLVLAEAKRALIEAWNRCSACSAS